MTEDEAVEVLDSFARYLDEQIVRPAVVDITLALEKFAPKPKQIWEMLGEYLREAAVLVLIFVPLDFLIPKGIKSKGLALTLLLSIGAFFVGAWLERRR